jgi:PAS domain S-box-containing protein
MLLLKDDDTVKHLPSPRLPSSYLEQIDGIKIGPNVGSCGTAMYRKELVIVSDIEHDPLWKDFKTIALPYGLRACWSLPVIHSNGKVMGSFAIYYQRIKEPTEQEWNTITKCRNLLRVLMENHFNAEEMRITNERYNIITDATHDLVWDWDIETGYLFLDPRGLEKVYGLTVADGVDTIDKWLEHLHAEDKDRLATILDQIHRSQQRNTYEVEYRFIRGDGTISHVFDRGVIIRNGQGKPVRMIGAAQNITDRRMLEQELFTKEIQKQKEVSQAIIDTQEKERADIGKELHDNVNQILTTTKLYLDLAATDIGKREEFVKKSSENILHVINEIRKLSRSLMLPSLGDLGLLESVNDLVDSINLTQKFRIDFITEQSIEDVLTDNMKLIIYRILQESVNNIIKHADATSVLINLSITGDSLQLIVSDDGRGFQTATVKRGAGLRNIENRVYLFNGTFEINTSPGKGCELVISIPLRKAPKN